VLILEGERSQTRIYFSKTPNYVRDYGCLIETQLGSIPVSDGIGKEVVLNIKTGLMNNRVFFTDSMGLEEQKRKIDERATWNYTVFEPVAGNYYPINSLIRMSDFKTKKNITVLTDRSQGGTALRSGEFEIMIHRRLLIDDWRGVGEPLDELDLDG
jgi:hypothetical protein